MSTLSSQFHTIGASVVSYIYGTYKPRSRDKLTNVIRLGVLFSILVSYIICYMLPHDIIARGASIFMGICAAAFLPAYFCLGYCKALFGRDVLISTYPFSVIDPILFALPLSVLAIIGVSMMTYKK